jgi:predicted flavoprotein YhiN
LAKARTGHSLSTKLKSALSLSPAAISLIREATANQLPANALALAQLVKAVPLTITERAGLARAISTAGGIKEDSVNGSLMLNALPGVFVAGEMLDWDAPTGGYLLQACFASAVQAAKGIMDWLQSHHPTR